MVLVTLLSHLQKLKVKGIGTKNIRGYLLALVSFVEGFFFFFDKLL